MIDLIGQEAAVGDYFVYALQTGQPGNAPGLAIYQLRQILEEDKCKAHKILDGSYSQSGCEIPPVHIRADIKKLEQWKKDRREVWEWSTENSGYREKTLQELSKDKNKLSTLSMFAFRALIIKDFDISKYEVDL